MFLRKERGRYRQGDFCFKRRKKMREENRIRGELKRVKRGSRKGEKERV